MRRPVWSYKLFGDMGPLVPSGFKLISFTPLRSLPSLVTESGAPMWEDSSYFWVVLCRNHWFHARKNLFFRHKILLAETDAFASRPPVDSHFKVRCDVYPGESDAEKSQLNIGSAMRIERRRATRHLFGGAAEVINVESQKQLTSLTRDLSLYGCFVTSKAPFPKGTGVRLKITNSKANFSAVGHVAYNLPDKGMGIAFVQLEPKDQAVLEEWLAPASAK